MFSQSDHKQKLLVAVAAALLLLLGVMVVGFIVVIATGNFPRRVIPLSAVETGGGFMGGFWHGMLGVYNAASILFGGKGVIYQVNNQGFWYDFAYLVGAGTFLSLVRLPTSLLKFGAKKSLVVTKEEQKERQEALKGLFGGATSILLCIVMFLLADGATFHPRALPAGMAPHDMGFFYGCIHGLMSSFNFMLSWFSDTITIYQGGAGAFYDVGYKLTGTLTVVVTALSLLVVGTTSLIKAVKNR